jgi:hypothetical protein
MPNQAEIKPITKEIRFSSGVNPLGLEIGDLVKIRRDVDVAYTQAGERKMFFGDEWTRWVRITGSVKRALGTYVKGGGPGLVLGGDYDYEPPSLKVSRYVRLYTFKYRVDGKDFLVHPDDIIETAE